MNELTEPLLQLLGAIPWLSDAPAWVQNVVGAILALAAVSAAIEPKLAAWEAAADRTRTQADDHAVAALGFGVRLLLAIAPVFRVVRLYWGKPRPPKRGGGNAGGLTSGGEPIADGPNARGTDDRGTAQLRVAIIASAIVAVGCGASEAQRAHGRLDTIAGVADPSYQLAVEACDALERREVAEAESREDAEAGVGQVRERCDHVFRLFALASAKLQAARAAVDAAADGRLTMADALSSLDEALAVYTRAAALVRGLMSALDDGDDR